MSEFNFSRSIEKLYSTHTMRAYFRWIDRFLLDVGGIQSESASRNRRMQSLETEQIAPLLHRKTVWAWFNALEQEGIGNVSLGQAKASLLALSKHLEASGHIEQGRTKSLNIIRPDFSEVLRASNIEISKLQPKVEEWLMDNGFEYRKEYQMEILGRADFLAFRDGLLYIVEVKNSLNQAGIYQLSCYMSQGIYESGFPGAPYDCVAPEGILAVWAPASPHLIEACDFLNIQVVQFYRE